MLSVLAPVWRMESQSLHRVARAGDREGNDNSACPRQAETNQHFDGYLWRSRGKERKWRGNFTDARKDKPGRIAAAGGGTLFLDEIADVSPASPVRRLRFLQERIYESLGSTQPVRANVRVIAATNKELETLVQLNRFRENRYGRINVVKFQTPSLREGREDVPFLVEHFITRRNLLQGNEITGVSDEMLSCLMTCDYPGMPLSLRTSVNGPSCSAAPGKSSSDTRRTALLWERAFPPGRSSPIGSRVPIECPAAESLQSAGKRPPAWHKQSHPVPESQNTGTGHSEAYQMKS